MTPKERKLFISELKDHTESVVRQTVNGQITKLQENFDEYVKEDMKWKERAEPMIKTYEHSNWLLKMFVGFLKVIGLIGGAAGAIIAINKFR